MWYVAGISGIPVFTPSQKRIDYLLMFDCFSLILEVTLFINYVGASMSQHVFIHMVHVYRN